MPKKILSYIIPLFLLLAGCAAFGQATPAKPPAPSETATPSPGATLLPTSTTTPLPSATTHPSIAGGGVFTLAQKQRLSAAALEFVASTEPEAIRVARSIEYLVNEGHPASMCGPLSLVILQRAGLIDPAIDPHSFWWLNPRPDVDAKLLQTTFPPERYEWISLHTPIDKIDFKQHPLYPGDFIYLYAGSYGTFEHVIVISRVDAFGRAYAVTNHNTADGYVITEVMLYDPDQPGIGQFYAWTDFANLKTGLTGFGGMEIWRRSTPIKDPSVAETELRRSIESLIRSTGGRWNISFSEIGGDSFYERLIFDQIHPASTIKVPIALLFFKALENNGVTDFKAYINSHVIMHRPMAELLRAMLVYSEEEATEYLTSWTVSNINYEKVLAEWGVTHTLLTPRRTTLWDMTLMYEGLYTGKMAAPAARKIILDLMSEYTPNDDTRLGTFHALLGKNSTIYNKRGTLTADWLIVADSAIVVYRSQAYIVLVYAQPEVNQSTPSYEQLDTVFPEIAEKMAEFLQTNP